MTTLPFELHPELPEDGVALPPGRYARVAAVAAEAGMPFRTPARAARSHHLLAAAELVRQFWPEAFDDVERRFFEATFVDGADLSDRGVVAAVLDEAGTDAGEILAAVEAGIVDQALDAARAAAVERGVTGTPAWLLDGRLVVPGVQDREFFERVVERLRRPDPPLSR